MRVLIFLLLLSTCSARYVLNQETGKWDYVVDRIKVSDNMAEKPGYSLLFYPKTGEFYLER